MNASDIKTENLALTSWVWMNESNIDRSTPLSITAERRSPFDLFKPIRNWLDNLEIQNAEFAHAVCKLIPAQCPFEREVKVWGRTLVHIPPMCKLNPVYEQVVALRFRALCYLADTCGEDITPYC